MPSKDRVRIEKINSSNKRSWKSLRSQFVQYLLLIEILVILTFLRIVLFNFGTGPTFLIFFIAVIIATRYGSTTLGVIASILTALITNFFFILPADQFNFEPQAILQSSMFIFDGLLMTFIVGSWKSSQKRLETEHDTVIQILHSITDAFMVLDNDWNIVYSNHQINHFLSIHFNHFNYLLGKNIWQEFPELTGSPFHKNCLKSLHKKHPLDFEFIKDEKCYEVRTYPSDNGLNIYITDVTERKELDTLKDNFISVASHELRTPTTTIQGFAQLLDRHLKKSKDPKAQMYSGQINQQVNRLVRLLELLLDASRMQSHQLKMDKKLINLAETTDQAIRLDQPNIPNHKIKISGQVKGLVLADQDRIEQVIVNLLNNAAKYSPQAKTILMELSADSQNATVSVTDYGIGIPKPQLNKVFDKFYQGSNQLNQTNTGIGLGLYICAEIIKQHRGKIWVDSEPEQKTTFHFSLPLAKS